MKGATKQSIFGVDINPGARLKLIQWGASVPAKELDSFFNPVILRDSEGHIITVEKLE
jgi:hypothetical protein